MAKKDSEKNKGAKKRFEDVFTENGFAVGNKIIVDKETGVHYLFSWSGYAGGITPLLDQEGKPFINDNLKE